MRNRIVDHVKIKAKELVPHELNPRIHSDTQRNALRDLYDTIGFARSLLAYRLPDGRLKLIDGHLRQSIDPDMEVEVEVIDVNDTEARALLLSIDPLAQLADYDNAALERLRSTTQTDSQTLKALWESLSASQRTTSQGLDDARRSDRAEVIPEKFLVLVECRDEHEQVALLHRFKQEGLACKAITT